MTKTTEKFVEEATEKHQNKFTYEKTSYISSRDKVIVTCKIHGDFAITAREHLRGKGCAKCSYAKNGIKKRNTQASFLEKARAKHGDAYDYSKAEFKSNFEHVTITCKIHGDFTMSAREHLRGRKCGMCGHDAANESKRLTNEEFVERAKEVHGERYDYSLCEYQGYTKQVKVICKEHGVFKSRAGNHLSGGNCPSCAETGFDCKKPAILYVLTGGDITKVGITNRTAEKRLAQINKSSPVKFRIARKVFSNNGYFINDLETSILRELRSQYEQPDEKFDGCTECFYEVNCEFLTSRIEELIKERIDAHNI